MPKEYQAQDARYIAPGSFKLRSTSGELIGEFRYSMQPRLDLVQRYADVIRLDGKGGRFYDVDLIATTLRESLVREVFDGREWHPVDDVERFNAAIASDRWLIPIETLGEIVMDILHETTGHPFGASSPSSPSPAPTPPTSTGGSSPTTWTGDAGTTMAPAGSTPSG